MPAEEAARSLPDVVEYAGKLAVVDPYFAPDRPAPRSLDLVAFHDFAFYEYLLPPSIGFQLPPGRDKTDGLSDYAERFLDLRANEGMPLPQLLALRQDLVDFETALRRAMYDGVIYVDKVGPDVVVVGPTPQAGGSPPSSLLGLFYGEAPYPRNDHWPPLNTTLLNMILNWRRVFGLSREEFKEIVYAAAMAEFMSPLQMNGSPTVRPDVFFDPRQFRDNVERSITSRGYTPTAIFAEYPFEVFPPSSVNVGLRLVYRQEWRPLGSQRGEIVRTIPLGPGQKERVTTKIVRRRKASSSSETTVATETSTEATESTKDSSEIVQEAAEANKWYVDAKTSASFFGYVTVDVSGGASGTSENKSKDTSAHLSEVMEKTASKIRRETKVVVSTEAEQSTEHEYSSELSNPNNEVAVTYEFYKLQHQYQVFTYLAEVESVVMVAEAVPAPAEVSISWVRRHDWVIAKVLKDESHRATLNELIQDLDEIDPVEGAAPLGASTDQDPFHDMLGTVKDKFANFQQTAQAGTPPSGLAIPDIYAEPQRIYDKQLRDRAARQRANALRQVRRERLLQHLRDNILFYCHAIWRHEDPDQRLMRYQREGRRVPLTWSAPVLGVGNAVARAGTFTPTGDSVPLTDVIDPTGPIAYIGNYVVFGVRPSPAADEPLTLTPRLSLVGAATLQFTLDDVLAQTRESYVDPDDPLQETLLDPALAYQLRKASGLTTAQLQAGVTDDAVRDLVSFLAEDDPRIAKLVDDAGAVIRDRAGHLEYALSPEEWARYLYRKNGSRRFLVDSNNLYLSVRVGDGASLEPFKRAHRYIDVLKAYEELQTAYLKNQRRAAAPLLPGTYDPDVAKVIIVGDPANAVAAAEAASTNGHAISVVPPDS